MYLLTRYRGSLPGHLLPANHNTMAPRHATYTPSRQTHVPTMALGISRGVSGTYSDRRGARRNIAQGRTTRNSTARADTADSAMTPVELDVESGFKLIISIAASSRSAGYFPNAAPAIGATGPFGSTKPLHADHGTSTTQVPCA